MIVKKRRMVSSLSLLRFISTSSPLLSYISTIFKTLIFIILNVSCLAQHNSRLNVEKVTIENSLYIQKDSIKDTKTATKMMDSLMNIGFLGVELIETFAKDSSKIYVLKRGEQYKWLKITVEDSLKYILKNQNIEIDNIRSRFVSPNDIRKLADEIIVFLENTGHPFGHVKLDSIEFVGKDSIKGKLSIEPNKKILIDSIISVPTKIINSGFLHNYLNIQQGEIFDKSKIDKIQKKINKLPFINLPQSPYVVFSGNKAKIRVDIKEKKINKFDFLLGLTPSNEIGKKYKITGEITAELVNKLNHGESFYLKYKSLGKGKQNLRLKLNYPYILNFPFGFDSRFKLYKNENKNIDLDLKTGVQYLFKGINYLKIYWNYFSSRLIEINKTTLLSTGELPNQLDLNINGIGAEFNYDNTDYKFNPRKGFEIIFDANIGQKRIIKNFQISELKNEKYDFSTSYDFLDLTTFVYNISADLSYFLPIANRFVIKLGNKTAYKKSQNKLYKNELYRLGGNKLLRGFDEESIYSDFFNVSTIELRLLIEKNSFIFAFFDAAIVNEPFITPSSWDKPYGFGVGINFDTKSGILGISAALGSQHKNPIDLKDVKVHIGYISLF